MGKEKQIDQTRLFLFRGKKRQETKKRGDDSIEKETRKEVQVTDGIEIERK